MVAPCLPAHSAVNNLSRVRPSIVSSTCSTRARSIVMGSFRFLHRLDGGISKFGGYFCVNCAVKSRANAFFVRSALERGECNPRAPRR
jgi:hypothetical protein